MPVTPENTNRAPFSRVLYLWIPRKFVGLKGVDVCGFVADVNDKIARRGIVTNDGQLVVKPIVDITVAPGFLMPEAFMMPKEVVGQKWEYLRPIEAGTYAKVILERPFDSKYEVPTMRAWQAPQRVFFGLDNPYQMAEDSEEYTHCHLATLIFGCYLDEDERIAAVVHGLTDGRYFYCPCHCAEVVYTTRSRLVCMGCGALHAVLTQPVSLQPKRLLTAEEWVAFFDESGSLQYEYLDFSVLDFCEIENEEFLWTTDQWDQAKHEFIFFARSSAEEIEAATRGTEADPSIFLEAGWTPVELPPPPAQQLLPNSVDVDLIENCSHSLHDGIDLFLKARKNSDKLINAVPQVFRAVELLLKAKLELLDSTALHDNPNMRIVLKRLQQNGVRLSAEEDRNLNRLRRLRNALQHGSAAFNHREALALTHQTIVFVNRFSDEELNLWIKDAVGPENWYDLLRIPQLAATARRFTAAGLAEFQSYPEATITQCGRCGEGSLVRPRPNSGASCLFCGYIPVVKDSDLAAD